MKTIKEKTTYEIINQGHSISPNLDRDEYYKVKWLKKEDVLKLIKRRIKKNKKGYKMTNPPKEVMNLNIFKNRIEELEELESQIIGEDKLKEAGE